MPIRATTNVDIREEIALKVLSGIYSISEIAERFHVSRPTVYKYVERYRADGRGGLNDRKSTPICPRRTSEAITARIVEDRKRFGFGAKKIRRRLIDADPDIDWPARSTIEAILSREGLTRPRRRRPKNKSPFVCAYQADAPGQLQTIDFKGQIRMRNGQWAYPLTIADRISRYLLACEVLPSTRFELVWPVMERVFREHGLPDALLSDNGPPFGGHGVSRFSRLSVLLMELGIQPVYITPGHPQQNGRHERMHGVYKDTLGSHRPANLRGLQRFSDEFRRIYNHERPHESLDQDRPASRHRPCRRPYPSARPSIEYDSHLDVRSVFSSGYVRCHGTQIFLSHALAGKRVGLEAIDDHLYNVFFGPFLIGRINRIERSFI